MKNINMKELFKNKYFLLGAAVLVAIIICAICIPKALLAKERDTGNTEESVISYENEAEQRLAERTMAYLDSYIELPVATKNELADAAVQNYRIVMASGTDTITDEITRAIQDRLRSSMLALIENSDQLSEEDLEGLSAGITEIIWDVVLGQLQQYVDTADVGSSKENYDYLIESLQKQIEDLQKQKTKVSINARINSYGNLDPEALSEEELQLLAEKMGVSVPEIIDMINNATTQTDKDLVDKLEKELNELRKELQKEIQQEISTSERQTQTTTNGKDGKNGTDGKDGIDGKNGKNGTDGKDGINGKDGKDGSDGKTTYIGYADDPSGTNFSLTPTETSKYVGTCITSESTQPTDYAAYSNWQEYRAYVITATTDDSGVTTVHID